MHVDCLLAAKLCLVTLLNLEQCSQFQRFRLQHVQMVNKTLYNYILVGYPNFQCVHCFVCIAICYSQKILPCFIAYLIAEFAFVAISFFLCCVNTAYKL